jgi:uncharacterized membrane protein
MKIVSTRYPLDIIICLLCNILLPPLILFNINETIRILLGLPFILFIPGYMLLSGLFPQNNSNGGLDPIEKLAFSFGLSMALVPLIGIGLYYSPFGLQLESILLSIFCIIVISGILAIYRWYKTPLQKRFIISLNFSLPKLKTKLDRVLFTILLLTIVVTIIIAIFVAFSPKKQETSTEFYLLGPTGKTTDYPKNLTRGQQSNITIGLINHEQKTMNYTIEIWLINQTLTYNQTTNTSDIIYHEMWFMTKLSVTLQTFTDNVDVIWKPQWEYLYNFSINKTGNYALSFLLYTTPTPDYNKTENYRDIAANKFQNAYENIYLWLNISE